MLKIYVQNAPNNMLISRDLPQFTGETALLIVTGEKDAKIYLARNGTISNLDDFSISKSHYLDREGHFKTRTNDPHGMVVRSGAVYEDHKIYELKNFLHEFSAHLKRVTRGEKISRVFLFAPQTLKTPIRKILPKSLRDRTERVFEGNFYALHPFELLDKIDAFLKDKLVTPMPDEAKKILNK